MSIHNPYTHSPKLIIITGPMAVGKTVTTDRIVDECGYTPFYLDGVHHVLATKLGVTLEDLNNPHFEYEYKVEFINRLRKMRYSNLVADGIRFTLPHIRKAFLEAVFSLYGEYILYKCFYLYPGEEEHRRYHETRQNIMRKRLDELLIKGMGDSAEAEICHRHLKLSYPLHIPTPPEEAEIANSTEKVLDWAIHNKNAVHPKLNPKHMDLVKQLADSDSYNPFYQTVEVSGERVIVGATESYKTWEKITKLGINYSNKNVAEIGCHHGYFLFKTEEEGGICTGWDIDAGAIENAKMISKYRGSQCTFINKDILEGIESSYDIIFALNVLHRVADMTKATRFIFKHSDVSVIEIGKSQLEDVMRIAIPLNRKVKKTVLSHRTEGILGNRVIVMFEKQSN